MDFFDLDELAEDVPVFGTQYQAANCEEFYAAAIQLNEYGLLEDMKIVLKREPSNENDPYAIKVSGRWELDDGSKRTVHLGYVPRKAAFMIGEQTEGEGKLYGELASVERHPEFVMDIRINIYVKY